jgi:hypothetical protein
MLIGMATSCTLLHTAAFGDKCGEPFGSIATGIALINSVTINNLMEVMQHGFCLIVSYVVTSQ